MSKFFLVFRKEFVSLTTFWIFPTISAIFLKKEKEVQINLLSTILFYFDFQKNVFLSTRIIIFFHYRFFVKQWGKKNIFPNGVRKIYFPIECRICEIVWCAIWNLLISLFSEYRQSAGMCSGLEKMAHIFLELGK